LKNYIQHTINSFINKLVADYLSLFGKHQIHYLEAIQSIGTLTLNTIAKSNAAYHDVYHTIMVADVAQEILKGKHLKHHDVAPNDWFHFVVSAFYHDIGYLRGLCPGDHNDEYIKNTMGETVYISSHATDAALAPYHIDRAIFFAKSELSKIKHINIHFISALIERTQFPVPDFDKYKCTSDLPGLLRAADLIGQLADSNYFNKSEALFSELKENGSANKFGYQSSFDIMGNLPVFFKNNVHPYIKEAIEYLDNTQKGKIWIDNLFSNVGSNKISA
jgi:hypothetical protein